MFELSAGGLVSRGRLPTDLLCSVDSSLCSGLMATAAALLPKVVSWVRLLVLECGGEAP